MMLSDSSPVKTSDEGGLSGGHLVKGESKELGKNP
jgi:hypothetical protein